ncbi:MAG: restriction endonuclease subunit S, partial [Dehalococcoidales bacterium]|nr:restriction endonuclease subunit S [Dehalococcoidales bacterium]
VEGKIWVNNHAHVLRVLNSTNARFLTNVLNVVQYRQFIEGSTRDKLTQDSMNNIPIQCAPIEEQQAIADYLDKETARIDNLINKINQAIEKLQEYRSALITAAVTGKIDVRQKAA